MLLFRVIISFRLLDVALTPGYSRRYIGKHRMLCLLLFDMLYSNLHEKGQSRAKLQFVCVGKRFLSVDSTTLTPTVLSHQRCPSPLATFLHICNY